MTHVILIEEDALVRKLLENRLCAEGWLVTALRDSRGLRERLAERPADLLVVDLGLPYLDGLATVEQVRAEGIDIPIMMLSAYDVPELLSQVRSTGANELLNKPYDQEVLVSRLRRLLAA
jgi:DNA-binding response OmpR family regulator